MRPFHTVALAAGVLAPLGGGSDAGDGAGGASAGTSSASTAAASSSGAAGAPRGLHVEGNRLVDGGRTVRLLGVDHAGTEYACIQGWGIFDGPADQAAVSAMTAWHVNAVRLPLNEDCWLGINGAPARYSGAGYRSAVAAYVGLLRRNGLYVILDLHWGGPGTFPATQQLPMADADHAPAFWTGVASAFKGDPGVVFDLYNEPVVRDWTCWRDGCAVTGTPAGAYTTAGMQQLLDAVRAAGAENVVMAGGLAYANDLTGWIAHAPRDPAGNLAASFHAYDFNTCSGAGCWSAQIQPVAARVPVVTGELGEKDCAHGFIDRYMAWADGAGVSYLGWSWNADFDCKRGPALVSDWSGTPTAFGAGLEAHLAAVKP